MDTPKELIPICASVPRGPVSQKWSRSVDALLSSVEDLVNFDIRASMNEHEME